MANLCLPIELATKASIINLNSFILSGPIRLVFFLSAQKPTARCFWWNVFRRRCMGCSITPTYNLFTSTAAFNIYFPLFVCAQSQLLRLCSSLVLYNVVSNGIKTINLGRRSFLITINVKMATGDFYDPPMRSFSLSSSLCAAGKKHIPGGAAAALRYLYYAIIFYNDN